MLSFYLHKFALTIKIVNLLKYNKVKLTLTISNSYKGITRYSTEPRKKDKLKVIGFYHLQENLVTSMV